jgi:hypothetical protein
MSLAPLRRSTSDRRKISPVKASRQLESQTWTRQLRAAVDPIEFAPGVRDPGWLARLRAPFVGRRSSGVEGRSSTWPVAMSTISLASWAGSPGRLRRSVIGIAPTPEPSLSSVAGNPSPGLGFGLEAGDFLEVAARPDGPHVPHVPYLHGLGIDSDALARFRHARQYAPCPSHWLPQALPQLNPLALRCRCRRHPRQLARGRGLSAGLAFRHSA